MATQKDIASLTVVLLKKELSSRGLSTTGRKAELVKRLSEEKETASATAGPKQAGKSKAPAKKIKAKVAAIEKAASQTTTATTVTAIPTSQSKLEVAPVTGTAHGGTPVSGRWWKPVQTKRSGAFIQKPKHFQKDKAWKKRKKEEQERRDIIQLEKELRSDAANRKQETREKNCSKS